MSMKEAHGAAAPPVSYDSSGHHISRSRASLTRRVKHYVNPTLATRRPHARRRRDTKRMEEHKDNNDTDYSSRDSSSEEEENTGSQGSIPRSRLPRESHVVGGEGEELSRIPLSTIVAEMAFTEDPCEGLRQASDVLATLGVTDVAQLRRLDMEQLRYEAAGLGGLDWEAVLQLRYAAAYIWSAQDELALLVMSPAERVGMRTGVPACIAASSLDDTNGDELESVTRLIFGHEGDVDCAEECDLKANVNNLTCNSLTDIHEVRPAAVAEDHRQCANFFSHMFVGFGVVQTCH